MENASTAPAYYRQLRILIPVFVLLVGLLALAYFLFLRTDYAVLYSGLKPADASAIVAELDAKGISYRLRDRGTTILVAEGESDSVRLGIAGSDVALKGSTGFELFNKSDMGLTDFAQKINYQRALQGELSRTIMAMDGVVDARVHLALPDKSLFRGSRSEPKAAVAVTWQRGRAIEEARVAGIQRLVAAAVPELALGDVVVLDELGRVISPSAAPDMLPPAMEEQSAVQRYYRARARAAVEQVLPGLDFDVRVLTFGGKAEAAAGWQADDAAAAPAAARDFRLRLTLVTRSALNADDQQRAAAAIGSAVALRPQAGDALEFAVGPTTPPAAAPAIAPVTTGVSIAAAPRTTDGELARTGWSYGWLAAIAVLAILATAALAARLRGGAMSDEERDDFVQRIRRQLGRIEASGDARA